MYCGNCGKVLNSEDKFCTACGTPVSNESKTEICRYKCCGNCGIELDHKAKFCPVCGGKAVTSGVNTHENRKPEKEDGGFLLKVLTVIFCLLLCVAAISITFRVISSKNEAEPIPDNSNTNEVPYETTFNNYESGYYVNGKAFAESADKYLYIMEGDIICIGKTDGTAQAIVKNMQCSSVDVVDDMVYFISADDGYIYTCDIGGNNLRKLSDDKAYWFEVVGDELYYTDGYIDIIGDYTKQYYDGNSNLYKLTLDGNQKQKLTECVSEYVCFDDDRIYYFSDNCVYTVNKDGKERTLLFELTENEVPYLFSGLGICGDVIYYSLWYGHTEENDVIGIYSYNIKSGKTKKLIKSNPGRFMMLENKIYYVHQVGFSGGDKLYVCDLDGQNNQLLLEIPAFNSISMFEPNGECLLYTTMDREVPHCVFEEKLGCVQHSLENMDINSDTKITMTLDELDKKMIKSKKDVRRIVKNSDPNRYPLKLEDYSVGDGILAYFRYKTPSAQGDNMFVANVKNNTVYFETYSIAEDGLVLLNSRPVVDLFDDSYLAALKWTKVFHRKSGNSVSVFCEQYSQGGLVSDGFDINIKGYDIVDGRFEEIINECAEGSSMEDYLEEVNGKLKHCGLAPVLIDYYGADRSVAEKSDVDITATITQSFNGQHTEVNDNIDFPENIRPFDIVIETVGS